MIKNFTERSGFIEGTLVHTDKGLVPIEKIKASDMVLSKETHNSATTYKPVLNIHLNDIQEVWGMNILGNEKEFIFTSFLTHFWAYEYGDKVYFDKGNWVIAEGLNPYDPINVCDKDTKVAMLVSGLPLMKSEDLTKAFYPSFSEYGLPTGHTFDLNEYKVNHNLETHDFSYEEATQIEEIGSEIPIEEKIYNIEVADYHTYFVGKSGIWVHD